MSDLAKDEEASLLQFLEGRARGGLEVSTAAETTGAVLLAKEEKQGRVLRRSSEPARSSLASVLHAAAAGSDVEGEAEEEERAEWDQFRVHPLDQGKAKRDSNRAVGGASHSTTPSTDNRQALIDQSIKQHRQLFFGVPEEKQEESFLTLAAISYFFAESEDDDTASVRGKGSDDRWQSVAGDSGADSDDGGMRPRRRDSSGGKRNRRSGSGRNTNGGTDSTVGGRKRSFSDASANDQAATAKTGRRSRSGAPAARDDADKQKQDKEKKKKDKSKRHKSVKTWALDDLPKLPGLEYISANLYKCRKPKLERIMGCECQDACTSCACRGAQMECCHNNSAEDPCKCSSKCKNQRLTKGKVAPVSVVKTKKKGYGVVADATIKPRTLIMEYMGEIISETEKNRRIKRRDGEDNNYFMELYSQKVSMHRRSTYES